MYQFFIEASQVAKDSVFITGNDLNHMKNVVRLKPGEIFRVSVKDGKNYLCELSGYEEDRAVGHITEQQVKDTELKGKIQLFQGLPKGDKMELIIQKAVELGVSEIIPIRMRNCVVKLDEKKGAQKVARWQAIAEAAAKQAKRSIVPVIHEIMDFQESLAYAADNDINLVPYENEDGISGSKKILSGIRPNDHVGVFVGPEGGFDEKEIALARESMQSISLGNRILRTETAAIAAVTLIMMQMEE
ncbi:MAG: RsmE family RNA methyltransferase [Lachnospiraceae bacterium]